MTKLTDTYTLSNGLQIPKIGFGTWQIPANLAQKAVLNALDLGYRHIDTALVYQNEQEVGAGIQESNIKREEIFITSKLPAETKSYDQALQDFETTMANLQLDYLDLYLIHAPWPWAQKGANYDQQNREVWQAMEEIYASRRVKAIGVSNFNVHDLQNILDVAQIKPLVNQIRYFIGNTENEITEFSQAYGMLVEAYSPLATGELLNNQQLQQLAKKYGVSLAQLAIQFCVQNGVLPLPKAVQRAHAANNAQLDFVIETTDMEQLNNFQKTI
ncbi:MAG: aldo/keto reductase [Lactobacillus sp.]|nr:aldo/keto reductase [Lactobacillus sp.]